MSEKTLTESFFVNKGQIDQFGYKVVLRKNTNKSATEVGFTTYVRHFRIYESLMSMFMYVEGLITDGGGMIQRLGIQPGDVLEFHLFKDPSDSKELKIIKEFVIEQLGGQNRNEGQKSSNYTFRAVSKASFEETKNKIKKTFSGKCSDIVKGISIEYLRAQPQDINSNNFTETFGDVKYIASSITPFEAISNISKYAIAAADPNDTNFFFYETKDGLNFKSLSNIIKSANGFSYIFAVDKNRDQTNVANDYFRIQEFIHHQSTDQRKKIIDGVLKNKTLTFNFISRSIDEQIFNLREEYQDIIQLGDHLLMDEEEIDNYVGDDKRFTDEEQSLFVRCSDEAYDQTQDFISSARSVRDAQKALMNQTVLTVTLHGNPRIRPGDIIDVNINQASGQDRIEKDFVLSGKFLVGSCVHSVTDVQSYITICDLFKDSYERSVTDYRKDINSHFVKPRA
jgi:hypothetical protein